MAKEAWSRGDLYEPYAGRWSRPVGRAFIEWITPESGRWWLDVGCGTGVLSGVVLSTAKPASAIGVDPASGYVDWARARVLDGRVEFRVGDTVALPVAEASVDYVVSGLVLNFIPDPGATIGGYVWDYGEGMQLIRRFWDAAIALNPAAADLDEAARFPLCQPDGLHRLFADAGLGDLRSRAIVVPTVFAGFKDYWTPFLGGEAPAPGYCVALSDDARERLRRRLLAALPVAPDGSIHLSARAWAVQGTLR